MNSDAPLAETRRTAAEQYAWMLISAVAAQPIASDMYALVDAALEVEAAWKLLTQKILERHATPESSQ